MIFVFIRQSPNLHKDSFRCRWPCIRFGWICETREKKKQKFNKASFPLKKWWQRKMILSPLGNLGLFSGAFAETVSFREGTRQKERTFC